MTRVGAGGSVTSKKQHREFYGDDTVLYPNSGGSGYMNLCNCVKIHTHTHTQSIFLYVSFKNIHTLRYTAVRTKSEITWQTA